jgi:gliding motility-associated-like protein
LTVTTNGNNNSVTVSASTATAGVFTYSLVSVEDSQAPPNPVNVSGSVTITVNPQPVANLGGTGSGSTFGGFPAFRVCSNTASQFTFTNTSTSTSTNTNYTIDWGDSSPNFTGTSWGTLTHTYQIGLWYLTYSITGSNGCSITRTFVVFVGSNPAVSLGNPGNTDICNANSLTFPITGTSNNPPGTTYTVSFNDGSTPQVFNHPPPTSVTHTFTTSSCGTTSSDGSNSYPNSFSANIVATNPCSTSSVGVVPIYVSANPQADFNSPQTACVNSQVCLSNTSQGNQVISNTCSTPSIVWSITPSTGFNLAPGSSLGNDFSSNDSSLWLSGSDNLCLTFITPGTYTITIKTGNKCGIDTETKTICVQLILTPQFTLNTTSGCAPLTVNATNTTNLSNQCSPPTYLWQVTYAPAFCGTSITPIPNQTTSNATFNFTESGTYTIRLSVINSCGTTTTTQIVTVKKPPTVTLNTISNACGTANITPVGSVINCAPAGGTLTYAWNFPGGTPATSNVLNPGTISYPTGGPYTVSFTATNECGISNTATQSFTVSIAPIITNTVTSQTICSGSQTTPINLTANPTGTTFAWTATATAGITGFTASGNGAVIPAQTITTTNTNPGTVTYVVTPTFNGCVGTPFNYVINVNPAPSITTQPASSSVCLGGTATAMTVSLNSSTVTPTYQWYSNTSNSNTGGTLIPGATNPTYTPPTNTVGTVYYYCVISLSSGGCSSLTSAVATVTVSALPTITTQPLLTQTICVGATVNAFSVAYSGGLGTVSYQWFSNSTNSNTGGTPIAGATSSSYTPSIFTTVGTYYYYVVVTLNGNGCGTINSNTAEVVVAADPTITTQPLATQTQCQNTTATTLTVTASGGIGVFSYQWFSNSTNSNSNGVLLPAQIGNSFVPPTNTIGTTYYYCVVSQSGVGCSVTSATAAVTVVPAPSITTQPQSVTVCEGSTLSPLTVAYTNGIGTPTYQWFDSTGPIAGATTATYTPSNTTSNTYYCVITFSSGGCTSITSDSAVVTINPLPTLDNQPLSTQSICVGGAISALTVSYTGGAGTPTYQWYSNTTNTTSGGTTVGTNSPSYTPPTFTTTGTFYYYVTISLNGAGCGIVTSNIAQVIVVPDPVLTTQPLAQQTLCQNTPATVLEVQANGGIGSTYAYQWYVATTNNTTSGTLIIGETNSTLTPPTNVAGTLYYYCVVTQNSGDGCNVTSAVATVTVNLAPDFTSQPLSSNICLGQTPTVLSFVIVNGVGTPTYQWYSNTTNTNTGGVIISGATSATYAPPSNVPGTTYYYCVVMFPSITGGCSVITTNTAAVIINPNPEIAAETVTICSGTSFSITPAVSGGNIIPLGTTYTWSTPLISPTGSVTGATAEVTPQTTISQNLVNTTTSPATVTYTVTPVSGVCVGIPFTVTVTVNPAINPNVVVNNNACFGVNTASITTNITGGIPFSTGTPYQLNWTGPNGFTSNSTLISNISPGVYQVTIADAGGCPFSNSYTISEPADIVITVDSENDVTCFNAANGSINLTVTGGTGSYTYNWTQDGSFYAATEDIANLSPGTYVVTVTDANNCGPKTATFTITQPPLLVVSLISQTNVLCFGAATGAINVSVSGGTPNPTTSDYTYSWVGPNGFTSNNQNLTALFAGVYDLAVTDYLGCVKNLSVTITQSTAIVINYTTTPITCYGANNASLSATITGGNGPYQYQWNNLATSLNQTNLSAGTYVITVTDNVGCIQTQSIVIPEAPVFTINPIVNNVSCYGANNGSINLNLTGGIAPVALTWSDGSTSGLIRNNLPPGTYTATISDGTPCYIVRTFTIIQPQPLVLSANTTNPLDCTITNNGAIDLIVSGGTPPFTYSWTNGATTEDLNSLVSGNYGVTVTDANNCVASAQYTLIRPAPIQINVTTETDYDCGAHEVTQQFVAQASGGVPPYQYQWSSGNVSGVNGEIMSSDINGAIILTVTDGVGCTATYTVDVDNPVIGYSSFDTTSFGYSTYGIYSIGDPIQFESDITGDYVSVSWDFGDGTFSSELSPTHTYLIPRDYVVTQTVTYPFGCVYVQTITLVVEKGYMLVVPTAFTPNNDSLNDTYRPVSKRLKNIRLDIYDTWGSLVYTETGDVLVGWDGKIKGFNAENGNYYSKVTAETFYGTIVNENQTFVLIK